MSLSNFFFGGDLDEDPIFGSHMRQMQQITNSLFPSPDPFGFGMFGMPNMGGLRTRMNLMPHRGLVGFGDMGFGGGPMNRLIASPGSSSFTSSSSVFISNGSGPAQVYKETSSVRSVNGVKETRKTVEDSTTGVKKMAIGHHANGRARIVEKEQNVRTGQREEREELINLDDDETEEFERTFQERAQSHRYANNRRLQIEEIGTEPLPAIQSVEDYHNRRVPSPRRAIRSSPLALPSSSNIRSSNDSGLLHAHHPYSKTTTTTSAAAAAAAGGSSSSSARRQMKKIKGGHLNHHH